MENKSLEENNGLVSNDINQYIIGEKLGEGIFGTVKLGVHKITKEIVAIKILNKNRLTKEQKKMIEREISIHQKLNHYNIIKLYSIIETDPIIYLIQEYSDGKELSLYIQNHVNLEEKDICRFFQQIISGVEYLHDMGIVHRDLKPENILLTRTNDIKIADFGLSNFYIDGKLLKTACGSPYYAPPEMLQGKPYNGFYSDIYSCGIILYYMLTRKLPFNEKKESDTYKKILSCKFDIPKKLSKNAKDLLKKMIRLKPEERIKLSDIKKHPWFNLYYKELNMPNGLNHEKIIFPIDEEIMNNMEEIGFNKMETRYNIIKNEHNNITATYYLLLNKKTKKGRKSVADLHSESFEEYIKDPKNQLENNGNDLDEVIKHRINSKKILDIIPDFNKDKKEDKKEDEKETIKIDNNHNEIDNKNNDKDKNMDKEKDKKNINIKIDINNKKNNINKNSIKKDKVKKSVSCEKINKRISLKLKPKINNISLSKEKNKNNISVKSYKQYNTHMNKEGNLSARIKPKSIITDLKKNINNKTNIKSKPIINKTIQTNNISYLKNKQNNNIKRRLSTESIKNKSKIQFKGIVFTPKKTSDKINIFKTQKKANPIKYKKKLPFAIKEKKVPNISSKNNISQKKKIKIEDKLKPEKKSMKSLKLNK